ncbi:MAG TPA: hypothetical protein VFQ74_00380, partial [Pseudolysinimonas sp.]|nr:hypothetical protein [Pseudolysinimonas sp.]
VIYACWDASAVKVLNSRGQDVTPKNRIDSQTLEIVTTTVGGDLPLVVESDNSWPGSSSC